MNKVEEYLKYKEINDLKFCNDAKNFVKYNKIYKKVNDAYTKNLTTLNNACRIAKTSQRTYYRACDVLNKKTIVELTKKKSKRRKQYGGANIYNIVDKNNIINTENITEMNLENDKYRLTENDYRNNNIVNDTESKELLRDLDKEIKDYSKTHKN